MAVNAAYQLSYTGEQVEDLLGQVTVNKNDIAQINTDLDGKVDKVAGKGLSENDFTTADKNKLSGIASGAEVNVNADWDAVSGDAQILNKPTIPSKTSQLTNDSGYITDAGVTSFNGQTGAVTYTSPAETDPVFKASPAYGISSSDISSWNAKQPALTFDSTPTAGSSNPVTSSGIKAYVDAHQSDTSEIEAEIDAIEAKIPSAASSINQLADKAFVNSSIATNTATFKGTFNSLAELQQVTGATNNDYAFVIEYDAQGNEYYDRYKYNGSTWVFEYKIESTPFTADQWAAIQSGITSGDVTKLAALPTNAQLTASLAAKQDTISDLAVIRQGAAAGATAYQKPSGGIPKSDLSSSVQTSLDKADSAIQTETDPVFSASPAAGITSSDISSWNAKQSALTFDSTPTASSTNPVTSGGVKTALDLKANQSTTYTKTEVDALFDDVAYLGDDDGQATTLDFDAQADTVWNIPQTLGSSQQAQARANIGVVDVSGTNDGTNWTSITIGSTTKAIPSGGSSGDENVIEGIKMNNTSLTPDANKVVDLGTVITSHQDISGKAEKSEMGVSASGDQTTITLKSGTSATVINAHQSLTGKQDVLVSGTNIKTINNESLLGSGNITVSSGGGSGETNVIESISINGTTQTVTNKNVDLPVPISSTITAIVSLTEAQYTALATKDSSTLYVILES